VHKAYNYKERGPVYLQVKIFYELFCMSCVIAKSIMSEKKGLRNLKAKRDFSVTSL